MAARAGADAVKLQRRHNPTFFTREFAASTYESPNAFARTYGEHRKLLELSDQEFDACHRHAISMGVHFICTSFDVPTADFLYRRKVDAFKIASADILNVPLLERVASFGRPVIASTAASSWQEIDAVARVLERANTPYALLHCTALYPSPSERMNLAGITALQDRFPNACVGFSSHHAEVLPCLVGRAIGASIIEVHVTLDRRMKGTDQCFSLEEPHLTDLCKQLGHVDRLIGSAKRVVEADELAALRKERKSIVAARDISPGAVLTSDMLALRAPGDGIPANRISELLGRTAIAPLRADDLIRWCHLTESHQIQCD
jgi:N-acetylneuraminate synthase/sialic acid synthase